MKCPLCKGCGKVNSNKNLNKEFRREIVQTLLKANFGIREIQRLVGFKSPRSVSEIKKNL